MSDKETQFAEFNAVAERFIALANEIKSEGKPLPLVNAAFMSASATFSTYVTAGNQGYLKPSGVDRLVDTYRAQLANIQEIKRKTADSSDKKESKDN